MIDTKTTQTARYYEVAKGEESTLAIQQLKAHIIKTMTDKCTKTEPSGTRQKEMVRKQLAQAKCKADIHRVSMIQGWCTDNNAQIERLYLSGWVRYKLNGERYLAWAITADEKGYEIDESGRLDEHLDGTTNRTTIRYGKTLSGKLALRVSHLKGVQKPVELEAIQQ